MTPERWRQIEELYHSARERGIAVLEGTDPDLRREVERLLAQESGDQILDRPLAHLLNEVGLTTTSDEARQGYAGQTISHYDILEKLGAGGMGVVYKAFDTKLNRLVALKFLPPHLSHDQELKTRLAEEARAASALDHPNIVVIHDIDETPAGDVFIAMAFHEGITLRERIASGALPVAEALRIARQVASGLARAHEHGIVHRDIKPGNIVVAKDGVARIIDFGLAKSDEITAAGGAARGTPLYMSPEQASGSAIDFRTDLWSLGAVLYEMLAGRPPFVGDNQAQVIHAVVNAQPPVLRNLRPDVPAELDAIVSKALRKNRGERYQSAGEMVKELSAVILALESPRRHVWLRPVFGIPAGVLVVIAIAASIWFYQRSEKRHWAREQAIPEIARLKDANRAVAGFRVLQQAQQYLRADAELTRIAENLTHAVSIRSSPPGATVEIKDYVSPEDAWLPLGTTPLANVKIPNGYLRWRISKPGVGEYVAAPLTDDIHGFVHEFDFPLDAQAGAPKGTIFVPATHYQDYVWSIGDLGPYDLPAFYIDRFEVTNREYQEFVDAGGYRRREYWKEKFVRDGKELSWDQAMSVLHDASGRPGPSTWQGGHYLVGQADYPVAGVSWYEAAAYSVFAGKSLPTISQWYLAAPSALARYVTQQSNFSPALAPAGKFLGIGPWGTYDMAGNVAEWALNEAGAHTRYQLGGAWNTSSREYIEPGGLPPFHRDANAGFRCVRNTAALPPDALAERRQTVRDFSKAKPVPDQIFRVYKAMYAYDRTPLNPRPEITAQDSPDWHKEKITIDAAYGNERIPLYLFLPARGKPPYQVVVFYPSARVLDLQNSSTLGDMQFIDYIVRSGRAVLYPVYKGTYERPAPFAEPNTVTGRETLIQDSKDIGRSIDYIETRPDMDAGRIAFLGVSMGAALGVDWAAVEDRFKAVIMLDGGFYLEKPLEGTDQADFAPRLKAPTLLIAGRFDWIFLGKDSLLRMLGAPPGDKKVVLLDTAHNVSEERAAMTREVLAWLDKYLGKID